MGSKTSLLHGIKAAIVDNFGNLTGFVGPNNKEVKVGGVQAVTDASNNTIGLADASGNAVLVSSVNTARRPNSSKLTVQNGRLLRNGKPFRNFYINAHDLFADYLVGNGSAYNTTASASNASASLTNIPAAVGALLGPGATVTGTFLAAGTTIVSMQYNASNNTYNAVLSAVTTGSASNTAISGVIPYFIADLPVIAGYGVKIVRVSAMPFTTGNIQTYVGTDGTAPAAGYLSKMRIFLDACNAVGLGVELNLFWSHATLPLALSSTQADYATTGSTTRTYIRNFTGTIAQNFAGHPALSAYQVGNEWFDFASLGKFVSTSTDAAQDHFGALIATNNDIVAAVRAWDIDRAVISPSGSGGSFEGSKFPVYINKFIRAAGNCDIVAYHLYPDTDRSGFSHAFVGGDFGGADIVIAALRNACYAVGKVLSVEEFGADDDNTTYGAAYIGAVTDICNAKCLAAGIELIANWGWYVNTPSLPDLKTQRFAVMAKIQAANLGVTQSFIAPKQTIPVMGNFKAPAICARGSGAGNSWFKIPNHADLSPDAGTASKFAIGFWLRKNAILGPTIRLFANNDGTNGIFLTPDPSGNEGLDFQMLFSGGAVSFIPSGFTYPANQPANPSMEYPGEWNRVWLCWDGTQNAASWSDNKQHVTIWINGVTQSRFPLSTTKTVLGLSTRDLYFLAASDGASNFAQADLCDVQIGKGFTLTSEMVRADFLYGTVPTGIQHRWKLDGNVLDSIGSLHGVAGSALTFVPSGLGSL